MVGSVYGVTYKALAAVKIIRGHLVIFTSRSIDRLRLLPRSMGIMITQMTVVMVVMMMAVAGGDFHPQHHPGESEHASEPSVYAHGSLRRMRASRAESTSAQQ